MAVGAVGGAVKPVTFTDVGRVERREERQAVVMEGVELGFMRRMEMGVVGVPVMEGREVIVGLGLWRGWGVGELGGRMRTVQEVVWWMWLWVIRLKADIEGVQYVVDCVSCLAEVC